MRDHREIRDAVEVHVRAAAQDEVDALILADELLRYCWPGGQADRTEPAALTWLSLWGPVKVVAAVPECGCASGHCTICN